MLHADGGGDARGEETPQASGRWRTTVVAADGRLCCLLLLTVGAVRMGMVDRPAICIFINCWHTVAIGFRVLIHLSI